MPEVYGMTIAINIRCIMCSATEMKAACLIVSMTMKLQDHALTICTQQQWQFFVNPHVSKKFNLQSTNACVINLDDFLLVNCTDGDIRLYGGSTPNEGILHVCANGVWGTVCSNSYWNSINTDVACFQLGYYNYGINFIAAIYHLYCYYR